MSGKSSVMTQRRKSPAIAEDIAAEKKSPKGTPPPSSPSPKDNDPSRESSPIQYRKHWPTARESFLTTKFSNTAFNFIICALGIFSLTLIADTYRAEGKFIPLDTLINLLHDVPLVIFITCVFYLFCFSFWVLVRLIVLTRSSFSLVWYLIYSLMVVTLLFGPVAVLRRIDPQWSFLAGGAVGMQAAVFIMKMHSYFFTCRHIHLTLLSLKTPKGPAGGGKSIDLDVGNLEELQKLPGNSAAEKFSSATTLSRFFTFVMMPTLCFYLSYPQYSGGIRWAQVFKHLLEFILGAFLMYIMLRCGLIPAWQQIVDHPIYAFVKSLIPGFVVWMLACYVVFHSLMNFLADLTKYEDRRFYEDWWAAPDYNEWWRLYNTTVTDFMRRHIYFQSIRDAHFSHPWAAICVFILSALWHEWCMQILLHFNFIPPAMSGLMIFQIALVFLTPFPIFHNTWFGNFLLWFSWTVGFPLQVDLYAFFYCLWVSPNSCQSTSPMAH